MTDAADEVMSWEAADAEFIAWLRAMRIYVPEGYVDYDRWEVMAEPDKLPDAIRQMSQRDRVIVGTIVTHKEMIVGAMCDGAVVIDGETLRFTPAQGWPFGPMAFGVPTARMLMHLPAGPMEQATNAQLLQVVKDWAELPEWKGADDYTRKLHAADVEVVINLAAIFHQLLPMRARRGLRRRRA